MRRMAGSLLTQALDRERGHDIHEPAFWEGTDLNVSDRVVMFWQAESFGALA